MKKSNLATHSKISVFETEKSGFKEVLYEENRMYNAMTARKIIKIGQTETMQMKSLFYYLHSMLIHLVETGL